MRQSRVSVCFSLVCGQKKPLRSENGTVLIKFCWQTHFCLVRFLGPIKIDRCRKVQPLYVTADLYWIYDRISMCTCLLALRKLLRRPFRRLQKYKIHNQVLINLRQTCLPLNSAAVLWFMRTPKLGDSNRIKV